MNPLAQSLADAIAGSTALTNDDVRAIVASPHFGRINHLLDRLDDPAVSLEETAELDRLVSDALTNRYEPPWTL